MQEFHIVRIQSRKNVSETNIVVIYNHAPRRRISLVPSPSFLPFLRLLRARSRRKRRRRRTHRYLSLLLLLKHILGKRQKTRERNLSRDTPRSREKKEREARRLFCGAVVLLLSLLFLCHSSERRYINTNARFFRPILPRGDYGTRKMETRRREQPPSRNAKNEQCFDEANEEGNFTCCGDDDVVGFFFIFFLLVVVVVV